MKSKAVFAGLLSVALFLSVMTACSQDSSDNSSEEGNKTVSSASEEINSEASRNDESRTEEGDTEKSTGDERKTEGETDGEMYTLTVRDSRKSDKITAGFINTMSGASEDIEMTKTDEGNDYYIYTCQADTRKYNMVHLDYGADDPTLDVAFDEYVSGWYLSDGELSPYVVGKEPDYNEKYETKTFQFEGYDLNVYIWVPDDYDSESEDKYSTIYVLDGQVDLLDNIDGNDEGSWHTVEHVESMMSLTDNKAVVVGIESGKTTRDDELIPNIGKMSVDKYPSKQLGDDFADFICDTVIPYIESNYNVYADAEHTSVTGSSLGGLEAFYTAVEHPDKIGTAGAMSPSFWAFDIQTWINWLLPKMTEKNHPYLYIYAGDYELDNGAVAALMNNYLIKCGYPKDRIVCSVYQTGEHLNVYWQNIFPEFLQAAFEHKVSALENGVEVLLPEDAQKKISDYLNETSVEVREPTEKDYVYYDNSETKWDKVCAYWWGPYGSSCTKITSNEYYSFDWPGIEMERIGDTDIYRVLAPSGAVGIIFNNGIGEDEMAEGNEAYQTQDIKYDKEVNPGKVYKIDMTQLAKAGKGIDKVKYKYSAGEWTDYNP